MKILANIALFMLLSLFFIAKPSFAQDEIDNSERDIADFLTQEEIFDDNSKNNQISEPFPQIGEAGDNINSRFHNNAILQILNKTTAKTEIVKLPINQKKDLENITLIVHKCWRAPLEQKPENKILLEVYEKHNNSSSDKEKRIFYGWIFSSSPSVSGLEHPIYDITALDCKN